MVTQKTQSPLKIEDLTAVGDALRGEFSCCELHGDPGSKSFFVLLCPGLMPFVNTSTSDSATHEPSTLTRIPPIVACPHTALILY